MVLSGPSSRLNQPRAGASPPSWVVTAEVVAVALGMALLIVGSLPAVAARHEAALTAACLLLAALFLAEYLLRARAATAEDGARTWAGRLRWARTPAGLVDLASGIAIPLALAAGASGANARLFAVLWVLKLTRHTPAIALFARVVRTERRALIGILVVFAIVLILAATVAHVSEREAQPENFGSIPGALWWTITTLTTTGYGDEVPVTLPGRLLGGVVMICGIATFALWAGVLATGFANELRRQNFLETWDLVARVPLFDSLGATTIADMTRMLHRMELGAGQTIIRKGDRGDCMYFIVDGEVEVRVEPRPVVLGAGAFFGEMALITSEPRSANVATTRPSTLLVLDVADFRAMAATRPEIMRTIRLEATRRGVPSDDAAKENP